MVRTPKESPMPCPECLQRFPVIKRRGAPSVFCCRAHQEEWKNRQKVRGYRLGLLVMAHRGGKNKRGNEAAKDARTELSLLADQYNREDREAGRMSALDFLSARWRGMGILD